MFKSSLITAFARRTGARINHPTIIGRRGNVDAWGDEVPEHVQTEMLKEVRVA